MLSVISLSGDIAWALHQGTTNKDEASLFGTGVFHRQGLVGTKNQQRCIELNQQNGPFDEPCYTGLGPCFDTANNQIGVVHNNSAWSDLGLDGTRRSMLLFVR